MLGGLRTPGQYPVAPQAARPSSGESKGPGFTVIETLIVLAITGLLFISAAALISGKQNQTAFNQAIRQIRSQIQQVINEVTIGYYPNMGDVQCNGSGGTVTLNRVAGTEQGANSGCIFLGKAIQFQISGTDPEGFAVYSIAGLQLGGPGGTDSRSLSQAAPKVVAPTSGVPGLPDATVNELLQNGLTTARMWYNNGGADRNIGVVAFTSSLAQDAASGGIKSGSQRVDVVPLDDNQSKSRLNTTKTDGVEVVNSDLATDPLNPTNGVFLCFASGGTNQSGLITIGNRNRQLSVTLDIRSGTTC